MASDLRFKRTITDRVSVKGILSDDLSNIIYYDENKDEQEIAIANLLGQFMDEQIELSIAIKSEEDLDIIPVEDDE